MQLGFDNELYIQKQSEHIYKRIKQFHGKLYLEFGGKLFDDYHASRVLPGFKPNSKVNMLLELKNILEIIIVISALDIEKNKMRNDLGITYDMDVLRLIDEFRNINLYVSSIVIAQYSGQLSANIFKNRLINLGIKVFIHYPIKDYPSNISLILSDDGYGKNDYIPTSKPLVVVTAPGPGSGKMATCLSQLFHEYKQGKKAGYAKFETFPIWNLPLNHPINIAYEAATADLNDINIIDPFHLDAYGVKAVSYNRDVEIFPVLKSIFEKILGINPYQSPTDMGVNMTGYCITNDDLCKNASKIEVVRRYYDYLCLQRRGVSLENSIKKIRLLMNSLKIDESFRAVTVIAKNKSKECNKSVVAIELNDKKIITGRTSNIFEASASAFLNALKAISFIPDDLHIISPNIIEAIQKIKTKQLIDNNTKLYLDEILIALSISATTNHIAEFSLNQMEKLHGCEVHSSVMLSSRDHIMFKKLGMNLSEEPIYQNNKFYSQ